MKTFAGLSAVAVAFALAAGAASAQERGPSDEKKSDKAERVVTRNEPVRVRVSNHNWLDARVYVDDGGALTPLGFIVAQQTEEFTLPPRVLGTANPVRLVARMIGSRQGYVSQTLLIGPGDALQLDLHNQIGLSATSVLPVS
jgi:hypothetical protein